MSIANDSKVIGYFAYLSPSEVVCDGDACLITGSEVDLQTYITEIGFGIEDNPTIKKLGSARSCVVCDWGQHILSMKLPTIVFTLWPNPKG